MYDSRNRIIRQLSTRYSDKVPGYFFRTLTTPGRDDRAFNERFTLLDKALINLTTCFTLLIAQQGYLHQTKIYIQQSVHQLGIFNRLNHHRNELCRSKYGIIRTFVCCDFGYVPWNYLMYRIASEGHYLIVTQLICISGAWTMTLWGMCGQ